MYASAHVPLNVVKKVRACKTAKAKAHLDTAGATYTYALAHLAEQLTVAGTAIEEDSPGEFYEKLKECQTAPCATPGNDSSQFRKAQQPPYNVDNLIDPVCETAGQHRQYILTFLNTITVQK